MANRDLDRYLWIAGEYQTFLRNPNAPINTELKRLFTEPSERVCAYLETLAPSILSKAFSGNL